jgi:putative holliday junction resolvase
MKLASVDYGRRRIGLAVTDPDGLIVRSLDVVDRRRHPDAVAVVARMLGAHAPARIVVGLPLGPEDGETAMSTEARAFGEALAAASSLPVDYIDESYTSVAAHQVALTRKRKERRNKGTADRIAACLILEAYLRQKESGNTGRME